MRVEDQRTDVQFRGRVVAVQGDPVLDPFVRYPLVAGDEFGDGMLERAKASDVEAVLEKARPAWAVDSINSEDGQAPWDR